LKQGLFFFLYYDINYNTPRNLLYRTEESSSVHAGQQDIAIQV